MHQNPLLGKRKEDMEIYLVKKNNNIKTIIYIINMNYLLVLINLIVN